MVTLLLLAHPKLEASRANRALFTAVEGLPGVEAIELYALYGDGAINSTAERERLLRADRLVLQFPLYWYSVPPLLKAWQDEVLTPLFYLEPEIATATLGLPILCATTTGGPSASYQSGEGNAMTIDSLFAPLRAMARKCGWSWQQPFALHDVRHLDDASLRRAAEEYKSLILNAPALGRRSKTAGS